MTLTSSLKSWEFGTVCIYSGPGLSDAGTSAHVLFRGVVTPPGRFTGSPSESVTDLVVSDQVDAEQVVCCGALTHITLHPHHDSRQARYAMQCNGRAMDEQTTGGASVSCCRTVIPRDINWHYAIARRIERIYLLQLATKSDLASHRHFPICFFTQIPAPPWKRKRTFRLPWERPCRHQRREPHQ